MNTTKDNEFTVIQNNQGAIQLVYGKTSDEAGPPDEADPTNEADPPPQGIYCCTVSNTDDIDQTICVNTG
jgi:hypothetical protein